MIIYNLYHAFEKTNTIALDTIKKIDETTYYKFYKYDFKQLSDLLTNKMINKTEYDEMLHYIKISIRIYSQIRCCINPISNIEFTILADSQEKEYEFQQKKLSYGSFIAYHGSSLHNWFSILINGLKNYSGTSKMANGSAYGPGIYCAADINTSNSYARFGKNRFDKNIAIVSEVEIIKVPEGKGVFYIGPNHPYIRVIDESLIAIRKLHIKIN